MSEQISNSAAARITGRLGLLLFVFLIIGVLGRLSLRSNLVLNTISSNLESRFTNDSTSLSIDNISGDAWNRITLEKINYTATGTQLYAESASMSFEFHKIIFGDLIFDELSITGANLDQQLIEREVQESSTSSSARNIIIKSLIITDSNLDLSNIEFSDIEIQGAATFGDVTSISVYEFSSNVIEENLIDTLFISTKAELDEARLNLNEFILKSGETVIQSAVDLHLGEESIDATGSSATLYLSDLLETDYSINLNDQFSIDQFQINGNFDHFSVDVLASSDFAQIIELVIDFSREEIFIANKAELKLSYLELVELNEKVKKLDADFIDLEISSEDGFIGNNNTSFKVSSENISVNDENFRLIEASGTISDEILNGDLSIEKEEENERIEARFTVYSVFDRIGDWTLEGETYNLNPGWLTTKDLNGSLDGKFEISGNGIELDENQWTYTFTSDTGLINNQNYDQLSIKGWIDHELTLFEVTAGLRGSIVEGLFNSSVDQAVPKYSFDLKASNINLEDITGFTETQSSLTFYLSGEGEGISSDNIRLDAKVDLKDGRLNTGTIWELSADLKVRDEYLTLENALILSTFADGTISAYQNYVDLGDPSNETDFALNLKDLQPLASIFDLNKLNAEGRISGSVKQTTDGFSFFNSNFDLEQIELDEHINADSVSGIAEILFGDEISYSFILDILDPGYGSLEFEDLKFESYGRIRQDTVQGIYEFKIENEEDGFIEQIGSFKADRPSKTIHATVGRFDYMTSDRIYSLQEPFNLTASPTQFQTDTLLLQSETESYLWLSFSQYLSGLEACFVKTEDFDIGDLQDLLFKDKYLDGNLTGELEIATINSTFEAYGVMQIENLAYKSSEIDQFAMVMDIKNEQLEIDIQGRWNDKKRLSAYLRAPFKSGNPDTFPQDFFNKNVEGEIDFSSFEISRFSDLLDLAGLSTLEGETTAHFELTGNVGNPDLNGQMFIKEPTVSDIRLDSLNVDMKYDHDQTDLFVKSSLFARNLRAADLEATLPFEIDFRNFDLIVPSEEDELYLKASTYNLELALLNDFVDDQYLAGMGGRVEGEVTLSGTFGKAWPKGQVQLINSQLLVPYTNVAFQNINALVQLDSNRVEIQQMEAESENGRLDIKGSIGLDGIEATNLDLDINSDNFKISNTRDVQLWLSTSTKLTGTNDAPELVGDVYLNDGYLFSTKLGEGGLETVSIESDTLGLLVTSTDFYKRLEIDLDISLAPSFSFRNRDYLIVDIEGLEGELNAQKVPEDSLKLYGILNSEDGYARPLGKRFNLEEAEFIFSGDPFNPELYNDFSYQPVQSQRKTEQQVYISYLIEGTLNNPLYRFESDPDMERQDIIGYVLFNRPYYRLDPVEQLLVSTNSRDDVDEESLDLLLSRVEQLATQSFGVDLVEVGTYRVGQERGTSIQTGWFINEKTFFRIVNEIGAATPKTLFMLEYLINQNLDLIITQGNDRRQGIDLQWIFEY